MATIELTGDTFTETIENNDIVLVDFWAAWCGPCRQIGPALEEIATDLQGKVKIAKVNVDENPEISAKYGIRSIPTLMIFKDGKLAIMKTPNGENPLVHGAKPILGVDVWEHSYYIDYRNRRPDYLKAFIENLVNWEYVEKLYGEASK